MKRSLAIIAVALAAALAVAIGAHAMRVRQPLPDQQAAVEGGVATGTAITASTTPAAPKPSAPTQKPGPSNAEATARIGQTVAVGGVTITPLELVDDSRCPQGVVCVWAGTVHVRVRIKSGLGTSEMVMALREPVTTEGETVTLVSVAPEKSVHGTDAGAYRFTFRVEPR